MSIFLPSSNGTSNEKSRSKLRRGSVPVLYPALKLGGKSQSSDSSGNNVSGSNSSCSNSSSSGGNKKTSIFGKTGFENGSLGMYMCTLREGLEAGSTDCELDWDFREASFSEPRGEG
ncbi:Hypothetical protein FKW44_019376 [Caligus rogercresseyi]|uniref:Uncharacterized protein n=1 Tax=Caligus rogercresseyi TaxID=217165 RepID=A0A7T8GVT7_CALRO|nr:Hypothetical protein FKW44_019376 [Caligus rogercresseyi]